MKAQISLDFILAVFIAFVVIAAITVVGNEMRVMQTHSSARQQLRSIGTGLAAVITSSAALDDADTAEIKIEIPKLLVPGERALQKCKIVILGNDLNLSYDSVGIDINAGGTVWTLVPFVDPSPDKSIPHMKLTPALTKADPGECGKTLTITKVED